MVDIAASLSLTSNSLTLDPSAILGAETADIQAFGDLLAGQVKAAAGEGAARTLPGLPTAVAGNRQEDGKILPGAAAILPGMVNAPAAPVPPAVPALAFPATPPVEAIPVQSILNAPAPAAPAQTPAAPVTMVKPAFVAPAAKLAAPLAADGEVPAPAAPTAEPAAQPAPANPVHALLKMVATAIRTPRQVPEETAAVPADRDAAPETDRAEPTAPETDSAEPAVPSTVAALTVAAPVLPAVTLPTLQPAAPAAGAPTTSPPQAAAAQPFAVAALPRTIAKQPANKQAVADPLAASLPQPAPTDQGQPGVTRPAADPAPHAAVAAPKAALPSVPVLTVAAVPAETAKTAEVPVAAVSLTAAPARPAAPATTARIQVAVAGPTEKQPRASDRAVASVAATPAADRAAVLDRVLPAATPSVADASALAASAPAAPAPAAPVATAPTVEMPRQDFTALVERLVEARNAAAPVSTHASVQHAEFGQVSLHFQQDGNDLKVGMSSADPGFTAAVQAAMPAQSQSLNADTQQRGQSQQQSQSANTFAQSNNEAPGQRSGDAGNLGGDQAGSRQGRGSRGGNGGANPSPHRTGADRPQARGGVFA